MQIDLITPRRRSLCSCESVGHNTIRRCIQDSIVCIFVHLYRVHHRHRLYTSLLASNPSLFARHVRRMFFFMKSLQMGNQVTGILSSKQSSTSLISDNDSARRFSTGCALLKNWHEPEWASSVSSNNLIGFRLELAFVNVITSNNKHWVKICQCLIILLQK